MELFLFPSKLIIEYLMFLVEEAIGEIGRDKDTYLYKIQMKFDNVFMTDEGYGIFNNPGNINRNHYGIIVIHDETNVRIKYLVEIN